MQYDMMAIGVHPDDIELGCSGVIAKHIAKGQKVVMVDLTQGELGSRGSIATRYAEATAAQHVLGVQARINLKFRDGFFENDEQHKLALIKVIRQYRPNIIIGNALYDRHPDHGRANKLIEESWFLSGLKMIETLDDDGNAQEAWRPKAVYHYIQDRNVQPQFIVDISDTIDKKMASIACYSSQFEQSDDDSTPTYINQPGFIEHIMARAKVWGHSIGATYGEAFTTHAMIGLEDFDSLYLPKMS